MGSFSLPIFFRKPSFFLALAATALGVLVLRNAWLSDDIFITFRYLYNWSEGYGLVWNTPERVQAFTHPAWLLTLAPGYFLSGSAYLTALSTSLLFTGLTLVALVRVARSRELALAAVLVLLASRTFIDFSTSGLENPLSHCLVVVFIGVWTRGEWKWKTLALGLIAAVLLLNRLDLLLLVGPALAVHLFQNFSRKTLWHLFLGFLPIVLWEAFSLVYYGFFLPNTYYAKAATDLPRPWLLAQGARYFADSLFADFVALPVIFGVLAVGLRKRMPGNIPLAAGLGLYLLYILWVGGDFMSGRFFSVPLVWAVAWAATLEWRPRTALAASGLLLGVALLHPYHPAYTGRDYYDDRRGQERELYAAGIVDEKGMAWQRSAWLHTGRDSPLLSIEDEMAGRGPRPDSIVLVEQQVAVGWHGYRRGPAVFIVDELALTDPLLARLPALRVPYWRIGHFFRRVPAGYLETAGGPGNRIEDPKLREYYDRLRRVTEGPIWSAARWREIGRFLLGKNSALVDRERYATPNDGEIHRFDD